MKRTNLILTALATCIVFVVFTAFVDVEKEKPLSPDFKSLLQVFPKGQLPYAMNAEDLRTTINAEMNKTKRDYTYNKERVIRGKMADILPNAADSKFSRIPSVTEAVLAFETADNHALVYKVSRGYSTLYSNYYVSVFNKKGKHIRSEHFASTSSKQLVVGALDEQMNLTVSTYQTEWNEDKRELKPLMLENKSSVNLLKPKDSFKAMPNPPIKQQESHNVKVKAR